MCACMHARVCVSVHVCVHANEHVRERERVSATPFIKSLLGASVSPTPLEPNPIFGPQCQAESRGVIKNLILAGTVIMLVA